MRPVMARAIACGIMLLVLPSCGIPPLRRPDPAPCLPDTFNGATSTENSALLDIEEFYNDPTLTSLIREALGGNRELKNLNEEVQIASNEVLARSGQYLPFLSVGAGAGLNRTSRFTEEGAGIINDPYLPGRFFPNPRGVFQSGLNLTWQLDVYRQLRNARDAAGQRYNAASERRNYFVTTLVADIAQNYYRLMGLDKRIENLDQNIQLQEQGLEIAKSLKAAGRGTELGVRRFEAEVRRNQSEKSIVFQDIIETENRINFQLNRYPMPVQRDATNFYTLYINALNLGVPSQLLQNRPDIRQAERELSAAGLEVKVARVNFFPQFVLNAGTGLEAFDVRYLFEPQAVVGNLAAGVVGPLVNRRGIKGQYLTANARQLQSVYNYQRTILNAFTEVVNRFTMVQNYSNSLAVKSQQLEALTTSVDLAQQLFQQARVEDADYIDVLLANRDLRDARFNFIEAKIQQLTAIVNTYQALGGGDLLTVANRVGSVGQAPYMHTVRDGETFATIAQIYYHSGGYAKALWAINQKVVPALEKLAVGDKILVPPINQLDPTLIDQPATTTPAADVHLQPKPTPEPPPTSAPGPFDPTAPPDLSVKPTSGLATTASGTARTARR